MIRVALCQLKARVGDVEGNADRVVKVLEELAERSSEPVVAVFPELFLQGYLSRDLLYRIAVPASSPVLEKIAAKCRDLGCACAVGFAELDEEHGFIYNSAALINERGEISVYRKRHLPTFTVFDESRYFRPWTGAADVAMVHGVRVGVAICYDFFFPELFRAYALQGAALILGLSASPDPSLPLFQLLTRARALENTVFVAWANLVGTYEGLGFAGGSRVVGPLGDVVAEARVVEEDVVEAVVDPKEALKVRASRRPVLRDLRIDDLLLPLRYAARFFQ